MNLYAIIIKLLLNKSYYIKYYNIIIYNININNNKYIYKLLIVIKNLFDNYNKEKFTVEELISLFHVSYPALQKDEAAYFDQFFSAVQAAQVDDAIADKLFLQLQEQSTAEKIAQTAVQVAQGKGKFEDLTTLLNSIEVSPVEEEEQLVTTSIKEIHDSKQSEKGLRWRLATLNKSIGSLRRGNFGFIFARPEAGKTTFLASEITFMAPQTDRNVLWINNEQPGGDVISRCYSSLLGADERTIFGNVDEAEQRWTSAIGTRLRFVDNPGITKSQIENLCKKYDPALIVFDQLDKVHGFDAERYDLLMKAKYQWARELSKNYGPVIGVCQAGGTAENKRYLEMTDVDSSHTAKQGEADWILAIGKVNDAGYETMRYLHICKNKLPGDDDTDPKLRHGKMEVRFNEEIARYEDKINW